MENINKGENKIKIIVPFFNTSKWIKKNILSIKNQKYDNFMCYLVDDMSTDDTRGQAQKIINNDKRFIYIKNTEKKYALKNIYDTIKDYNFNDEDIVVLLDGDDWLASSSVLSKVNKTYNDKGCWVTYGSYVEFPSMKKGTFSQKIPQKMIQDKSYRSESWRSSHLRTFKVKLWRKIKDQDFLYSKTGKFIKAAWDLAFMFPMLEMSGDKAEYIPDIMYFYNRENPLNEDKVDHNLQLGEEAEVRSRKSYDLLESI